MKTLSILFSEPNVFSAVIDGINVEIRNPEILKGIVYSIMGDFYKVKTGSDCDQFLQGGDIFQVEGFEYEVNKKCSFCGWLEKDHINGHCYEYSDESEDYFYKNKFFKSPNTCIVKLAKEEEPKEQLKRLIDEDFNAIDNAYYLGCKDTIIKCLDIVKQLPSNFSIRQTLIEEIEKLKN